MPPFSTAQMSCMAYPRLAPWATNIPPSSMALNVHSKWNEVLVGETDDIFVAHIARYGN